MNSFFLLVFLCCQTDNSIAQPSVVKMITPTEVLNTSEQIHQNIVKNVQDYTGLLVKREMVEGEDTGYQYISFKYRENPRAIYLKFLKPPSLQNREVLYNGGEDLVVKRGGRKNASMTMYISVDSPLATEGNRYTIKDMGLQTLSERLLGIIKEEVNIPGTEITLYDAAKVDGRTVRFYRMVHTEEGSKCDMAEIAVDKELNIPIYYRAKTKNGIVLEEYSFRNIKLNVGLKDEDFDEQNPEYGFKKNAP